MKKTNEIGRSMIEMLGVLAIIGVLSAGALKGYNNAMMQHKLNKHSQEISYLLATAIQNTDKLKEGSFALTGELQSLGAFLWDTHPAAISDDPQYAKNIRFEDTLKNQIWFEHAVGKTQIAFAVMLPASDFTTKVCHNYINVFKSFADDLDIVYVTKKNSETGKKQNAYLGKTCSSGKCLATMTNADIINVCQTHCADADVYCTLYALWGYPAASVQSIFAAGQ